MNVNTLVREKRAQDVIKVRSVVGSLSPSVRAKRGSYARLRFGLLASQMVKRAEKGDRIIRRNEGARRAPRRALIRVVRSERTRTFIRDADVVCRIEV